MPFIFNKKIYINTTNTVTIICGDSSVINMLLKIDNTTTCGKVLHSAVVYLFYVGENIWHAIVHNWSFPFMYVPCKMQSCKTSNGCYAPVYVRSSPIQLDSDDVL